jgi:hypothetical protein
LPMGEFAGYRGDSPRKALATATMERGVQSRSGQEQAK